MTDAGPLPDRRGWAAAQEGHPAELSSIPTPLLRHGDPVAYVGGKLAAALIRPLKNAKFPPIQSDRRHPVLAEIPPEQPEYEVFGHSYGEVHTAREFRQLVERAARSFAPEEDRWREEGRVVDPFRPGLRYAAANDREFDVLQERHLNAVRTTFRRARTLLVALSQSEVREARADGAVFPYWPDVTDRHFDAEKHAVRALTVEETVLDLAAAVRALRALNPALGIVLMVSPEPQLTTAYSTHVVAAGTLGKAVLRIAMETVAGADGVFYFPALEIAGLRAPVSAYGPDGAIPQPALAAIAEALLAISEGGAATFDGVCSPIPVLRTVPVEPRAAKRARPAAAESAPAAETREAEPPPEQPTRKARPKSKQSALSVVDPYTIAKTAEARAKTERLAASQAASGIVAPPPAELEKPTLSQSERQVLRREKLAAREARLAAAASIPPEQAEAAAAARRKREEARAAAGAAAAAETAAPASRAAPEPSRKDRKPKKARAMADGPENRDAGEPRTGRTKPRRERANRAKS